MKNRCEHEANFRCVLRQESMKKIRFFEKGEIVLTLAGCSRMRVAEGSPEKEKYEKRGKMFKKRSRKSDAKNIGKSSKKSSKIDAKTMKKPSNNRCRFFNEKNEKPAGSGTLAIARGEPTNQQDYL